MCVNINEASVTVRKAARALGRSGLVHAYGHCSMRLDTSTFLVCPASPPGLVNVGEECTVLQIHERLPESVLGEVRLHQQIYQNRADINGVVRFMSPKMMSLAAMGLSPKPRHGFGAYFAPSVPLWDDPQLIRDDERAQKVICLMGEAKAVLMRGNGAVVAGQSLEEAVVLAWYLEDSCRIELDVLASGMAQHAPVLSNEEAAQRATKAGRIFERMWQFLTNDDEE